MRRTSIKVIINTANCSFTGVRLLDRSHYVSRGIELHNVTNSYITNKDDYSDSARLNCRETGLWRYYQRDFIPRDSREFKEFKDDSIMSLSCRYICHNSVTFFSDHTIMAKRILGVFDDFFLQRQQQSVKDSLCSLIYATILITPAASVLIRLSLIRQLRRSTAKKICVIRNTVSNATRWTQSQDDGNSLRKIPPRFDHLRERDATSWFRAPQGRARYPDPGHRRTCWYRVRRLPLFPRFFFSPRFPSLSLSPFLSCFFFSLFFFLRHKLG